MKLLFFSKKYFQLESFNFLRSISHPNVVTFFGIYTDGEGYRYIVTGNAMGNPFIDVCRVYV
jgi:serine/threonine protein kinase